MAASSPNREYPIMRLLKDLFTYRELLSVLVWKALATRYKQAYLGVAWSVLKPVMLLFIFVLVRAFVGIDSGNIPYPVLTFAALLPWTFFQESVSESSNSVVANAHLIKKIYFPRELFPLTAILTRLVDLAISFGLLAALMAWYRVVPTATVLWVPALILYTMLTALTLGLATAAVNVYYRDIGQAVPIMLSLLMYLSPVIYPLQLVKDKLLQEQAAGTWSEALYALYTINPLTGIIDGYQSALLRGESPDLAVMWPGLLLIALLLPLSYRMFKQAETHFADVI